MAEGGISRIHPSELHESPLNPRTIEDARFTALKYALEHSPKMMEARPIIATTNGEVVAGNMRLRAVQELGWEEVPVYIGDLSEQEKREWMLRDNQEYGDWVPDALAEVIREYQAMDGADTQLLGFTRDDLDRIVGEMVENRNGGTNNEGTDPPSMYGIVVECEDEQSQAELLEELEGRGFTTRALL
jgi:ParB-like chromosome segregation protein Spo0J